jgi:hippurate hydrolase
MKSNLVEGLVDEVTGWRHHLHETPELGYEEVKTAAFVASKLREFGFDEVHEGIGVTGIVGVLHGQDGPGGKGIGLRADMDALPTTELGSPDYKSRNPGVMHACGHDGHTALLLGAAKGLAETRAFDGVAYFIFQPAEEGGAGAARMIEDGLFDRFDIAEVYGLHNSPGSDIGTFQIRSGPLLAAADTFDIKIRAKGGHGAEPHLTADPVLTVAQIIVALQALVSRETRALNAAVLSVTQMAGANASNIIPHEASLGGTVRTFEQEDRDRLERRIREVAVGVAQSMGATAEVIYERGYPTTRNHPDQTRFAAEVATAVAGAENVDAECDPIMPAEDFAYMLEVKPGAYIFMGNGDTAQCHMPTYDFNDEAIPAGVSYWISLVEKALPTG